MKPKIILATTSPSRRAAFDMLSIDYVAEPSGVEEKFEGRQEEVKFLVCQLAQMKADAVAKNHKDGIVIGFDSAGYFNCQVIEKPKTQQEAFERLKALSGRWFEFYTGIYMINIKEKKTLLKSVKTEIQLRELSENEIQHYIAKDPRVSTFALGFDPLETYASTFIKEIKGSYNNITRGIPLEVVVEMLYEIGYPKL